MGVAHGRDDGPTAAGERVGRAPSPGGSIPVPDLSLVGVAGQRGRVDDPVVRQALMRLHALRTVNQWNSQRAAAALEQGTSSPLVSLGKLAMSGILHRAGHLHGELLGAEAMLAGVDSPTAADASYSHHNAFFTSIGGGTDQIQRNIIAERILGLPREPEADRGVPFRSVRRTGSPGSAMPHRSRDRPRHPPVTPDQLPGLITPIGIIPSSATQPFSLRRARRHRQLL